MPIDPINIKAEGVDIWMKKLQENMVESLRKHINKGLENYVNKKREEWYETDTA